MNGISTMPIPDKQTALRDLEKIVASGDPAGSQPFEKVDKHIV
jgi:hypothetical protein